MALNVRQEAFAREYLIDFNATQAAIRAGYSKKTAYSQGFDLLNKPEIQEFIAKQQQKRSERLEITADNVLNEIAKIAFFDVRKLFDDDGIPKHISKIDDNTAGSICGLDVVTVGNADSGIGQVLKYKLSDKNAALEKLCKYLGLFKEDQKDKENIPEPKEIIFTIKNARAE